MILLSIDCALIVDFAFMRQVQPYKCLFFLVFSTFQPVPSSLRKCPNFFLIFLLFESCNLTISTMKIEDRISDLRVGIRLLRNLNKFCTVSWKF